MRLYNLKFTHFVLMLPNKVFFRMNVQHTWVIIIINYLIIILIEFKTCFLVFLYYRLICLTQKLYLFVRNLALTKKRKKTKNSSQKNVTVLLMCILTFQLFFLFSCKKMILTMVILFIAILPFCLPIKQLYPDLTMYLFHTDKL